MFSCAGQVAIVTGGATGIGRASAEALASAGAAVAVVGLGESDPQKAADEIGDAGGTAIGVTCDVTVPRELEGLVAEVTDRWGRIDTVVANAGAALDEAESESGLEPLDRMFDLHVRSVQNLADLTLPILAASGGGSFIVMSSLAGLRGNRLIGGYGITKAASAQLARNIAVQWGPRRIRANALSPGVIATDFARPITDAPEAATGRLAKTPLGRFGSPSEVAAAVVWLASPGGAFVSGQNIVIDGGTLAAD
jgi:NAD(P)-dependent dehydrogenase (short-subunit alcohol dehydrogenase family)